MFFEDYVGGYINVKYVKRFYYNIHANYSVEVCCIGVDDEKEIIGLFNFCHLEKYKRENFSDDDFIFLHEKAGKGLISYIINFDNKQLTFMDMELIILARFMDAAQELINDKRRQNGT